MRLRRPRALLPSRFKRSVLLNQHSKIESANCFWRSIVWFKTVGSEQNLLPVQLPYLQLKGGLPMAYLLQSFGLSDPLQLFYLQQSSVDGAGPVFTGFRPVQLDGLMAWALETASCRQWQLCLRSESGETQLVTGLGTQRDWEQRCEAMLRA
jgi:hypothetical protein